MANKTAFELYKEEREYLKRVQKEKPEFFVSEHFFNNEEALPKIGIFGFDKVRPLGYVRLYPQDFIVEEIHNDRSISQVEYLGNKFVPAESGKYTLYADLVKANIPTFEAINRLANELRIPENKIGYSGIKDAQAITSQRISLQGVRIEEIKNIKCEGFFLSNFSYGKGVLQPGSLLGNRFSIFARTKKMEDEEWFIKKIGVLKQNGFLNYYQTQRFGGLRFMSHIFGKMILQRRYEETIKLFLTEPSLYDIKLIKDIRIRASEFYGDWRNMKEILLRLPYVFQNEMKVLEYLERNHNDFIGALIEIRNQTTLWVYSYSSLLFNKYLSRASVNKEFLPDEIPLALSPLYEDQKLYMEWFKEDNIRDISQALRPFGFLQLRRRFLATRIFPKDIVFRTTSAGVAISFSLPKGAYATTFLMNLFKLHQGLPIPEWIKDTDVDVKELLEIGSIEPAKKILKDYIVSVLDFRE